jgi:hypothetical protein
MKIWKAALLGGSLLLLTGMLAIGFRRLAVSGSNAAVSVDPEAGQASRQQAPGRIHNAGDSPEAPSTSETPADRGSGVHEPGSLPPSHPQRLGEGRHPRASDPGRPPGVPRAKASPFTVRVLDSHTEEPVCGATLTLSDGRFSSCDETGPEGDAAVPAGLFRVPIHIDARREGYHPSKMLVNSLEPGSFVTIRMFRESTLRIFFHSPDGAPIAGVETRLQPSGAGWSGAVVSARSDEGGTARFAGFPLGTGSSLAITADGEGFEFFARTYSLDEYTQSGGMIRVELRRGEGLEGRITGFGTGSGSRLSVEFTSGRGQGRPSGTERALNTARSVPVEPDGAFRLEGAPGRVRIRIRCGGEVLFAGDMRGRRGVPVEIQLVEPIRIDLRVLRKDGDPVPEARVVVSRRDEGFPEARIEGLTNSAGLFSFRGCSPDRFDGAVCAEGYEESVFDFTLNGSEDMKLVQTLAEKRR